MADFDLQQAARNMATRKAEAARVEQQRQNAENTTARNLADAISTYAASIGKLVKSNTVHLSKATIEVERGTTVLTIIDNETCRMEVSPTNAMDLGYSSVYGERDVFSFEEIQERLVDWLNGR